MEKEEIVTMAEFINETKIKFDNLMARARAIFDSRGAQPVVFTVDDGGDSENE